MPLEKRAVYSSHVDTMGYDAATQELHVTYSTGKTAVYGDVPGDKWEKLKMAPSVGEALHQLIRGQHEHRYL